MATIQEDRPSSDNSTPSSTPRDELDHDTFGADSPSFHDSTVDLATLSFAKYEETPSPEFTPRYVTGIQTPDNIKVSPSSDTDNLSDMSDSDPVAPVYIPIHPKPYHQPPPVAGPLYELKPSKVHGLGLFATKDISYGTRILSEPPLFWTPSDSPGEMWRKYAALNPYDKATFDTLDCVYPDDVEIQDSKSLIHLITTSPTFPLYHEPYLGEIEHHTRILATWETNATPLLSHNEALFPTALRLNHSCQPNVQVRCNPVTSTLTIHAITDIPARTELFMNYLGPDAFQWTAAERHSKAPLRNMRCRCDACEDRHLLNGSDLNRDALHRITQNLNFFRLGASPDRIPEPYEPIDSPLAAVQQAEFVLQMLLDEQLYGSELVTAFVTASRMAVGARRWATAVSHAFDARSVEIAAFGCEDRNYPDREVDTAEEWAETLAFKLEQADEMIGLALLRERFATLPTVDGRVYALHPHPLGWERKEARAGFKRERRGEWRVWRDESLGLSGGEGEGEGEGEARGEGVLLSPSGAVGRCALGATVEDGEESEDFQGKSDGEWLLRPL